MKRPFILNIIIILILLVSIGAIPASLSLISDSSGKGLQFPDNYLKDTFFENYFIPGLILLFVIGIFPLFLVFGLMKKNSLYIFEKLNILKKSSWQYAFLIYYGFSLIIWITVQTIFVPYFYLQTVISSIGIGILIITFLEPIKTYYSK